MTGRSIGGRLERIERALPEALPVAGAPPDLGELARRIVRTVDDPAADPVRVRSLRALLEALGLGCGE